MSNHLTEENHVSAVIASNLQHDKSTAALGMIMVEMRSLLRDNWCTKTNLDAHKSLYKESRRKYLEYQNETEKTLAILGKFVMNSRDIKVECDHLRDIVQQMKSERQFSIERSRDYKISIDNLKKQLDEEISRGHKLEDKAIQLTQIMNHKVQESIRNTIT